MNAFTRLGRPAPVLVLSGLLCLAVAALHVTSPAAVGHAYLLCIAAAASVGLLRRIDAALPLAPSRGRERRRAHPEGAQELDELARSVKLAASSARDFHLRVRPLLRQMAAARLAAKHGVALESAEARGILGEDLWRMLDDMRGMPGLRDHGVPVARLRAVLAEIDTI